MDGVALAAAAATGVLLGTRFAAAAAWVVAAVCLAAACLGAGAVPRLRDEPGRGAVVGVLVLSTLLASGGAAAAVRASAVSGGILLSWMRQPDRVEVTGTIAEEPRPVRYGGRWVVLTVSQVRRDGGTYRVRERAGLIVNGGATGRSGPVAVPGLRGRQERLAVGDRLRVRASVGEARWSDALGRQPPVVLRHPIIEERAPPAGAVLRISERVREAARRRALATLAPERAGLLVGMALGDTSLLPAELEHDFRAAGLTHLMAVSGSLQAYDVSQIVLNPQLMLVVFDLLKMDPLLRWNTKGVPEARRRAPMQDNKVQPEEQKAPEVEETKPKAKRTTSKAAAAKEQAKQKAAKTTLSDTAKKRLEELTKEIERIEGLKAEREALMKKERDRGVPVTDIAEPAGYSVARARQLLAK